jgi:SNF2 family DNA or RNA helicase
VSPSGERRKTGLAVILSAPEIQDLDSNSDSDYCCDESSSEDDELTIEEELRMMTSEDILQEKDEATVLASEGSLPVEIVLKDYEKLGYSLPASFLNVIENDKSIREQPFLLKHPLREYQFTGLKWLMQRYSKKVNGILADEMGLGKTIQTISLLAQLASEIGSWGPHLVVVPTSVMLNWEIEFKKWCPALKVLTYFGSAKERKYKRQGWSKPNSFHVCITTYRLVVQDQKIFRRKRWHYLILDEAHMIKNWKSQRWQTLLNFQSKRRLLITGTPLQNDLMELWSLLHFLMPDLFQSHSEFKSWFASPISSMVEGTEQINQSLISRLHRVLRPFILRRLKIDVEKNLPEKHEHVLHCQLSRRQRKLYEEYISSSETLSLLSSGNLLGVMNCLMQLRKVCNHPDLFAGRSIISSFDMVIGLRIRFPKLVQNVMRASCSIPTLIHSDTTIEQREWKTSKYGFCPVSKFPAPLSELISSSPNPSFMNSLANMSEVLCSDQLYQGITQNCHDRRQFSMSLRRTPWNERLTVQLFRICSKARWLPQGTLNSMILLFPDRMKNVAPIIRHFLFAIPKARAVSPTFGQSSISESFTSVFSCFNFEQDLRDILIRKQLFFPDKRLVQFDCGKLQLLSKLLRQLKFGGHKVLIFTQMTKMLDILETFLNLHGFTYCRLDGSTKPEQRQLLMQRFNNDKKIFVFILSTRSGGFGINLTGADTVIFYDSDWNPAVDHQAQDRCHRIGQTKEVNIYRLVCEGTIEENIMKKAMQKRDLDHYAIQSGQFDTSFAEGTQNSNQPPSHKERSAHGKISRFESEFSSLKEVETYAMGVLSNEENWMLQRYSDQKLKATAMREPQIDTAGSDSETEFEQDSVLDIDGWDTVSARILYHTYS